MMVVDKGERVSRRWIVGCHVSSPFSVHVERRMEILTSSAVPPGDNNSVLKTNVSSLADTIPTTAATACSTLPLRSTTALDSRCFSAVVCFSVSYIHSNSAWPSSRVRSSSSSQATSAWAGVAAGGGTSTCTNESDLSVSVVVGSVVSLLASGVASG